MRDGTDTDLRGHPRLKNSLQHIRIASVTRENAKLLEFLTGFMYFGFHFSV